MYVDNKLEEVIMKHVYIVTDLVEGFYEHARVYADNKRQARKIFRDAMGSGYQITGIEEIM